MTFLVGLALRSSVMLVAGLLVSAALARRSAALRHRVLVVTLLAATVVMPVSLALPEWRVTLPARVSPTAVTVTSSRPGAPAAAPAAASPQPASDATSPLLFAWLAGAIAAGGVWLIGLVRVARVGAGAADIDDREWLAIRDAIAARYRLRRPVTLSRTRSATLLATWGVLRPEVLLPRHARTWTPDRVRIVLSHELAHVRRHDWGTQMVAEGLRVLLWFNPLAWILCTRLRRESEQACDDEVLESGVSGREYAGHLLELARLCRSGRTWVAAAPMAHPSTLERRVTAMLNPRVDRQPPSRRAVATCVVVLLLAMLPIAALRARQAGPSALSGTVYDASGGVLPGVEVVLVDANQVTSGVVSDATGRFQFPPVVPGKYMLEASLAGFRALRQEFELREARDWSRAVTLQVGDLRETVMIRGSRVTSPAQRPSPATPELIRVGGSIRVPRKVLNVPPDYPEAMREAGLTGVVPIEAVIGRDGTVSAVRVLSAQVHPDFAIAAVDAVRQWRFTPTLLNGAAVEVVMTVTVRFDLEG